MPRPVSGRGQRHGWLLLYDVLGADADTISYLWTLGVILLAAGRLAS